MTERSVTQNSPLLPQHQKLIDASAISPQVAAARGYRSVTSVAELLRLGFDQYQCRVPGLLAPIKDVFGENGSCNYRPDDPRPDPQNPRKVIKYEALPARPTILDIPPSVKPHLGNPAVPLWITESSRKVDSLVSAGVPAAIAVFGVYGWRATNKFGGVTALADWESVALKVGKTGTNGVIRRDVVLCFDSDVMTNPNVHEGVKRFASWLKRRGATVSFCILPHPDIGKNGVDDYLGQGHTREDLFALITTTLPPLPTRPDPRLGAPTGQTLDGILPERIEWLWRARLALGKMTIFDGDPGLGKSTVTLDIAARVTTGAPFPGEFLSRAPRGVVILSAEDGLADTIVPRLLAAGADMSRVFAMTGILTQRGIEIGVTIPDGLAQVRMALREMDAALLIIDPLVSHFSQSVNANNDQQVRTALNPLMIMLEQTRAAAFMVRHLNKADTKQALYRGGGSIGIIGASRFGMMVARDPDDPDARVMATTKCNLAVEPPSLRYRLESVEGTDVARVVWDHDAAPYSAGDLLEHAAETNQRFDQDEQDEVTEWLQHLLATEPGMEPTTVEVAEIRKEAKKRNYGESAMRRARKVLKIKAAPKEKGGPWFWSLPEEFPWEDA